MGGDRWLSKIGLSIGSFLLGVHLECPIKIVKPADVVIVGRIKRFLVHYRRDGVVVIVRMKDGVELYRG
jgi:hypothetical protein